LSARAVSYFAIRLDFGKEICGKLAERPAFVMVPHGFKKFNGLHCSGQMIFQVSNQWFAHLNPSSERVAKVNWMPVGRPRAEFIFTISAGLKSKRNGERFGL
jgi:hypothetical protein